MSDVRNRLNLYRYRENQATLGELSLAQPTAPHIAPHYRRARAW